MAETYILLSNQANYYRLYMHASFAMQFAFSTNVRQDDNSQKINKKDNVRTPFLRMQQSLLTHYDDCKCFSAHSIWHKFTYFFCNKTI